MILTAPPFFYGVGSAYQFAAGPLLYLYVRSTLDKDFKFTIADLLHFIPFFVFHFGAFPDLFPGASDNITIQFLVWHLQPLVYAALLIRLLHNNALINKEQYPTDSKVSFRWMRNVFYSYGAIWLVKSCVELALPYEVYSQKLYYIAASVVLTAFHVYIIAYLGFNRSESSAEGDEPVERYKGSRLSEKMSREYLHRLIHDMETEKSFTDPKLTLAVLASRLAINSRYLSQVINENLGQNFYDFVNGYRIEEAKRRLTDPEKDKYTIEAIAFEVGFNSKAAFYSTFKKQTKMTPSQFKEMSKTSSCAIPAGANGRNLYPSDNPHSA
ncbi:MAG: helix-turn-helix domain-containing protein [bacterium]